MRQAVLEFASELAQTFHPMRLPETIAWPKGTAVMAVHPCRDPVTLVVLIGGEGPEQPTDGGWVQAIFRSVRLDGGRPDGIVFCGFEPVA